MIRPTMDQTEGIWIARTNDEGYHSLEEVFPQDRHVEATPPMMKKSRRGEDASTQRSECLCAASQSQD
jgi:hypothetical protein